MIETTLQIAAALCCLFAAAPETIDSPIGFMHGLWEGPGVTLVIDVCRHQGRLGDEKPFQRDPLVIHNITRPFVVFFIGDDRFIGLFQDDELSVTGEVIDGSPQLRRISDLGGTSTENSDQSAVISCHTISSPT